jgi:hypothetical protein
MPCVEQPYFDSKGETQMTKVSITEVSIQFARVSLQNGQASEEECQAAVCAACAKGVDNFRFLRSRLYLQATNGDVVQTALWLREENEGFGDYRDNDERN